MTGYFVSLLMGLVVGVGYALVQVRRERGPIRLSVGLCCARRLTKRGGLSAP